MVQCGWPHGIALPRFMHLCVPIPPSQLLLGLMLLPCSSAARVLPFAMEWTCHLFSLSLLVFLRCHFHGVWGENRKACVNSFYQNPNILLFSSSLSTIVCSIMSQDLRLNRGQLGRTIDRLWYFIRYILYASLLAKTEGRREGRRKNGNSFPKIIF